MPAIETWPAARIATLKTMHAAGSSGSAIAAQLSKDEGIVITRNAVIGKIDRLNLPKRAKPEPTPAELEAKRERRRAAHNLNQKKRRVACGSAHPHRGEKIRMVDVSELPPLNLTLNDLTMRDGRPVECRFITNDDTSAATYCGHPVDSVTSWCPHHRTKLQPPKGWIGSAYVPKIACAA